ncbi:hypothetical protein [Kitasatospora sp. MAP5-34]|nr:hypothetical protein [Kitasatospora sp. MAP5-34]MDH6580169.1 hypothetical protein [Kitasatospora sp. MAP5-34]
MADINEPTIDETESEVEAHAEEVLALQGVDAPPSQLAGSTVSLAACA